jgi:hypothetical protein
MAHSGDYISGHGICIYPDHGILIPPMSIILIAGYIRGWRKHLIMFLPALIFLIFHSIFPNKQERFILPIIPFLIAGGGGRLGLDGRPVAGAVHWNQVAHAWAFFWVLNMVLLIPYRPCIPSGPGVESMRYLSVYRTSGHYCR